MVSMDAQMSFRKFVLDNQRANQEREDARYLSCPVCGEILVWAGTKVVDCAFCKAKFGLFGSHEEAQRHFRKTAGRGQVELRRQEEPVDDPNDTQPLRQENARLRAELRIEKARRAAAELVVGGLEIARDEALAKLDRHKAYRRKLCEKMVRQRGEIARLLAVAQNWKDAAEACENANIIISRDHTRLTNRAKELEDKVQEMAAQLPLDLPECSCGGAAVYYNGKHDCRVECDCCGKSTETCFSREEAVRGWYKVLEMTQKPKEEVLPTESFEELKRRSWCYNEVAAQDIHGKWVKLSAQWEPMFQPRTDSDIASLNEVFQQNAATISAHLDTVKEGVDLLARAAAGGIESLASDLATARSHVGQQEATIGKVVAENIRLQREAKEQKGESHV